MLPFNLLVILGPTATGKTRIGVQIARCLGGEIISADSRQVYRGMDLGTGKDIGEYGDIPYHLIDIKNPGEEFNVFEFKQAFVQAFHSIRSRGKLPLLVGGTGLYLESILLRYSLPEVPENPTFRSELSVCSLSELSARLKKNKPELHNTTDLTDRGRLIRALEIAEFARTSLTSQTDLPEIQPVVFGVKWDRQALRRRITRRLRERLEGGMIAEVKTLLAAGLSHEKLDFYGLEYRYAVRHLRGELNRNDLFQKLNSAIHQFARRQETWFRRMERKGIEIRWVAGDRDPAKEILTILRDSAPAP